MKLTIHPGLVRVHDRLRVARQSSGTVPAGISRRVKFQAQLFVTVWAFSSQK